MEMAATPAPASAPAASSQILALTITPLPRLPPSPPLTEDGRRSFFLPEECKAVAIQIRAPDQGAAGGCAQYDETKWEPGKSPGAAGEKGGRECRVCHLAIEVELGTGDAIVLGCHCKHDLALAHRNCAEAWFRIRGNRVCEICGATAQNIRGIEAADFMEHWNDSSAGGGSTSNVSESTSCWQNQAFCNLILASLVIAFILLWLFRVTIF